MLRSKPGPAASRNGLFDSAVRLSEGAGPPIPPHVFLPDPSVVSGEFVGGLLGDTPSRPSARGVGVETQTFCRATLSITRE